MRVKRDRKPRTTAGHLSPRRHHTRCTASNNKAPAALQAHSILTTSLSAPKRIALDLYGFTICCGLCFPSCRQPPRETTTGQEKLWFFSSDRLVLLGPPRIRDHEDGLSNSLCLFNVSLDSSWRARSLQGQQIHSTHLRLGEHLDAGSQNLRLHVQS